MWIPQKTQPSLKGQGKSKLLIRSVLKHRKYFKTLMKIQFVFKHNFLFFLSKFLRHIEKTNCSILNHYQTIHYRDVCVLQKNSSDSLILLLLLSTWHFLSRFTSLLRSRLSVWSLPHGVLTCRTNCSSYQEGCQNYVISMHKQLWMCFSLEIGVSLIQVGMGAGHTDFLAKGFQNQTTLLLVLNVLTSYCLVAWLFY